MAVFLFLVLVAVALGLIGTLVEGLIYLLIIGIVVFIGALFLGGLRLGRRSGRRVTR
ncbi:hypothetical protein [Streptomyces sp. NBC_00670]|jgi:hypothetical protein|uniref:hypothetical protein n=1 Tax=Streptomyces sp. NBC_00670 TaxID=2975804 RepID=UPI002E376DEA|nr:hypothetical protein [Streptomyces sp. NBC_00670]